MKLNDVVTVTDFNNTDLKNQLETEGLEIYFNNKLYLIRFNLEKIKKKVLDGEKIDSIDYERYKTDIDNFLKQNNKQIVSHASDPIHNTIDFYSAENIQSVYGKTGINLEQYNSLTREQRQDYEKNPFSDDYGDTYLYIKSNYYTNYTKLQLYKLLKSGSSNEAITLLNNDTSVLLTLNGRDSIEVKTGNTLLHIAAQEGLSNLGIQMLDKGANPNFPNKDGNTPLHIAMQLGLSNLGIQMLDKGANPNVPNKDGNTPLSIAQKNKLSSVVNKINNKGGSIKKKTQRKIRVNNIMAKSRRNVSRRKRQQKRRKSSRRNFRKMLGGGRLIDDLSEDDIRTELKKLKSDEITDDMIENTINQLKKNKWDEYSLYRTINIITVQEIIEKLKKKNLEEKNLEESANPPS